MAWNTPITWTAVVVTVSNLNQQIRDNMNYLKAAVDASSVNNSICQGRLTLTASTPVTTSDVTAATTLRYTPYKGNQIALYNGASWAVSSFPELSISVPAVANK